MKRIIIFTLILTLCLTFFSSCNLIEDTKNADALVKEFVKALSDRDFEKAASCVHPDANISESDLEDMVNKFESDFNLVLSSGVEYTELTQLHTHFSSSAFPKSQQTTYTIGYRVLIGERIFDLNAIVIDDLTETGIMSFELTLGIGF